MSQCQAEWNEVACGFAQGHEGLHRGEVGDDHLAVVEWVCFPDCACNVIADVSGDE